MREYPFLADAIGQVIEIYRKNSRKTKTALADFSGLERRYLREIERGAKKPTVNAVYSICDALNVPPAEFFAKVEEERLRLRKLKGEKGVAEIGGARINRKLDYDPRPKEAGKVLVKIKAVKTKKPGS